MYALSDFFITIEENAAAAKAAAKNLVNHENN